MNSLVFPLLPLALALAAESPDLADPVVREGWDWTLPTDVKPVRYSGYFTWGPRRFHPSVTVRGVMVTWKRLNPAPGRYDWDWLRAEIHKNRAAGMRTGIHLKGVQRDAVPDWVVVAPEGQAGKADFRDISIVPVPRAELVRDLKMDFRLVTEGPGDVTVTMVRVIKLR